jgi:hypothetical protein
MLIAENKCLEVKAKLFFGSEMLTSYLRQYCVPECTEPKKAEAFGFQ